MSNSTKNQLAGIEYIGLAGISTECQDSILRLVQYREQITRARILSYSNSHSFLLTVNVGDLIAVKSGFGSGYLGEGSRAFSYILQLLHAHGAEIEEYDVDEDFMERLDISSLTIKDIKKLDASKPVRPNRWNGYIFEDDWERKEKGTLWEEFRQVIPFAIIDKRITDLAIRFWENPDDSLISGYRRLEDIVRKRSGIDEHGQKLFSQVFSEKGGKLSWKGIDSGEHAGRVNLFTGVYMAYRNPRAHRELNDYTYKQLSEFLLLNQLYILEEEAF